MDTTQETPETMRLQWEGLLNQKAALTKNCRELSIRLTNFSTDKSVELLMLEKRQMEELLEKTQDEIMIYSFFEEAYNCLREELMRIPKEISKKDYDQQVMILWHNDTEEIRRKERKNKKIFAKCANIFREMEAMALKTTELSTENALGYVDNKATKHQEKIEILKIRYMKTEERLKELRNCYEAVKKRVENELRQTEEHKNAHNKAMEYWATYNLFRLKWILGQNLLPKDTILPIYQKEHPDDDISDLLSVPREKQQAQQHPLYREKPKIVPPQRLPVNNNGSYNENEARKQWQFFIGRGKDGPWQNIPIDEDEFLLAIRPHLTGKLSGLQANLLHKKLLAITIMDIRCRQNIKRLRGKNLRNFQSIDIGIYRVLLNIEEIPRSIKFMVYKRAELYPKNKKK